MATRCRRLGLDQQTTHDTRHTKAMHGETGDDTDTKWGGTRGAMCGNKREVHRDHAQASGAPAGNKGDVPQFPSNHAFAKLDTPQTLMIVFRVGLQIQIDSTSLILIDAGAQEASSGCARTEYVEC